MYNINIGDYLNKETEKAIENAYDKDFLFKEIENKYYRKTRKAIKKEFIKNIDKNIQEEVLETTSNGELKRKLVI